MYSCIVPQFFGSLQVVPILSIILVTFPSKLYNEYDFTSVAISISLKPTATNLVKLLVHKCSLTR